MSMSSPQKLPSNAGSKTSAITEGRFFNQAVRIGSQFKIDELMYTMPEKSF